MTPQEFKETLQKLNWDKHKASKCLMVTYRTIDRYLDGSIKMRPQTVELLKLYEKGKIKHGN